MKVKVVKNELREDEIISPDNAMRIGERMACKALKTVLAHSYNNRLVKLYMGLVTDMASMNNPDHIFSDGYDIAQEATCFLCNYMGKPLNEVCAYDIKGRLATINKACFSRINQLIMNTRKDSYAIVSNGHPEVINFSVPFNEQIEEDWTVVDETIKKLNLSDGENDVLNCYLAGMGFEEIVAYLSVAVSTVWNRRKKIQCKYNTVIKMQ